MTNEQNPVRRLHRSDDSKPLERRVSIVVIVQATLTQATRRPRKPPLRDALEAAINDLDVGEVPGIGQVTFAVTGIGYDAGSAFDDKRSRRDRNQR